MKKGILYIILIVLLVAVVLAGCTAHDEIGSPADQQTAGMHKLEGIEAVIVGNTHNGTTRAGTVTKLEDYVGRDVFVHRDKIVFTKISRTTTPLTHFTYPNETSKYDGIDFVAGSAGGWSRDTNDGGPERIYWTDAENAHTFVGYSTPQDYFHEAADSVAFDWKPFTFTTGGSAQKCFMGSLGEADKTGAANDTIDYTLTVEEQKADTTHANNTVVYSNRKLENEDLLLAYDTDVKAEPGGSVALIDFYHALSSIRVVVNISGFSSSSTAADNAAVVSNMRLLDQPTMYFWMQSTYKAQALRNLTGATETMEELVNAAYGEGAPRYDQKKALRLWIPQPDGVGENQSKTFTFYGITTPQEANTTDSITLKFNVTYPNPMKPSTNQLKTYTAKLGNVGFQAGYNTTINISLNHKNEQMTIGAQYENWQFVATPDAGELKKNSTFLQHTDSTKITTMDENLATADDATWLYKLNNVVYDIYGNKGDTEATAYKICTANQLLSFAYEVRNGHSFEGKFIRLDADITMQTSAKKTKEEMQKLETSEDELKNYANALNWIGIGDDTHSFNGTFIGGDRYIYRLNGKPLFKSIGSSAKIKHLQMTVIDIDGTGAIAESNAGLICGSIISGDVTLNGNLGGAFIGTNTGNIFCSYHIGDTESNNTAGNVSLGGLVGTNSGEIANCYHAGRIVYSSTITPASTEITTGAITCTNTAAEGNIVNNYYNSNLLSPTYVMTGVTGKTSAEMTKTSFVETINTGIDNWHTSHTAFDWHQYQHNPANYPTLSTTIKTQ